MHILVRHLHLHAHSPAEGVAPAVLDYQVGASADDADEQSGGLMALTSATLLNVDGANEWNGVRFLAVTIPVGATIEAAYLTLNFPTASLDEPDVTISGLDTANPGTFTTDANNISGRTRTTASVNWASANLGAPGNFNTADLSAIVAELVASYDYSAGSAMGFVWTSRAGDVARDTSITAYDGTAASAPKLHIEYRI
jgi:type IV pilus assembly protein PilY1